MSFFTWIIIGTAFFVLVLVGFVVYILTLTAEEEPDPPERPWLSSNGDKL